MSSPQFAFYFCLETYFIRKFLNALKTRLYVFLTLRMFKFKQIFCILILWEF